MIQTNRSTSQTVQPVTTPEELGIRITDVDRTLKAYIKQRYRTRLIILVPIFVIWAVLCLILTFHIGQAGLFLIAIPIMGAYAWYNRLKMQFETDFLEAFARSNNYGFTKSGEVERLHATIFGLTRVDVLDIVSGTYSSCDMKLFVVNARQKQGRDTVHFTMSVMQIRLNGTLPHIFMANKHINDWVTISSRFPYQTTLSLEGDFGDLFTLYANPEDRIKALEIFSPNLMAFMEDESRQFSVEFDRDYMHIYINGLITTDAQIMNVFDVTKKLIDIIEPLSVRIEEADRIDAEFAQNYQFPS